MEEKRVSPMAYPANSRASKEKKEKNKPENAPAEPREIKPVVSKSAKEAKKGPIKRLMAKLFADDFDDIKTNIVSDTIIPALRDMLFDAVSGGLSMVLYGETYSSHKYRKSKSHIDYGKISSGPGSSRERRERKSELSSSVEDLAFEYREDAVAVLDEIMEIMETYDMVSIADVYSLAGIPTQHTDNKYGWDNPADVAKMKIARSGRDWVLKLPKPYPID